MWLVMKKENRYVWILWKNNNKKILDIDNEEETHMEIINQKKSWGYMLYVEIEGQDNDGYKPSQFFQINYCPMCGRKLVKE